MNSRFVQVGAVRLGKCNKSLVLKLGTNVSPSAFLCKTCAWGTDEVGLVLSRTWPRADAQMHGEGEIEDKL